MPEIAYPNNRLARRLAGLIAFIAIAAILTQLSLNLVRDLADGKPWWMVPVNLYGYFTIWSNTLVAIIAARFAIRGDTGAEGGLFGRPWLLAATVVYITVVGLIYNLLLIDFNPQTGLRKLDDLVFHTIVPIAYPLWWFMMAPRQRLGWNALAPALIFPLVYSFVAMAKGAVTGSYAYFFIDVGRYGVPQVLLNIAGLALLYAALMTCLIAFDRRGMRNVAMHPAA